MGPSTQMPKRDQNIESKTGGLIHNGRSVALAPVRAISRGTIDVITACHWFFMGDRRRFDLIPRGD